MSNLATRLAEAMADNSVTQADLARACGVSPPSVHDWLSGKTRSLKSSSLLRASAFLRVRKEWLAEGRGPMRDTGDSAALEMVSNAPSTQLIPVAGVARLGENGWYDEIGADGTQGYVDHHTRDPDAYVLRVRGDSMYPAIRNGWYVVVEPSMALSGGIYAAVAMKDGRKMVKEFLYQTQTEFVLQSVNGGDRLSIPKEDVLTISAVSAVVAPGKHRD